MRATGAQFHSTLTESRYGSATGRAYRLLQDSPLASMTHIMRRWEGVEWKELEDQRVTTDAEVARDGTDRITLYPSLLQKSADAGAAAVLREFGHLLYAKADDIAKRRWTDKLCLPGDAQIDAVQRKLTPQFKSYRELVESFNTAMDRYVALNLVNALIANGVPYPQCQNLCLKKWGATQEYANRRRFHILIPLASAYSSKEIYEDFGAALADWVCGTKGIGETSVAEAIHGLMKDILENLR
jgi:hypothetical protein